MRLIVFACLLPIALSAQPQTTLNDLCSIEGRVVNALTGEPLKKTTLTLRNTDPGPPGTQRQVYSTVTGADGQFAMKDIEPGSYALSAVRSGFLRASYGARSPNQSGATLRLSRGQSMKEVDFRLTPQAVISGRVLDEDGDPVQNARIQLLRLTYRSGKKQLNPASPLPSNATNDLGEYRIFGLQPGRYALAVTFRSPVTDTVDHSVNPRGNENYVPTYYPGTADANAAVLFSVEAGAEVRGIDVRLLKTHAVNVRGHVTNNALPGRHAMMVSLVPISNTARFQAPGAPAEASGRFEIRNVVPGSYRLFASISEGDHNYYTQQPVEVHDEDVENLSVTISPGVALPVHVSAEGNSAVDWERVSFNLFPTDSDGGYYGGPFKREDQTFRFEDVSAGHYYLLGNLPEGYFIKSARFGDVDVLVSGLAIGSDPPAPVEVVLNPNAGRINGVVTNPEAQQPPPFSAVVLVPQEKERRDQRWYYKTVTADRSGNFALKSVAPGEYNLYAWDEIEDGAYMDPDFLKPFEAKCVSVSVKEGSQLTEQIALISTATLSAATK